MNVVTCEAVIVDASALTKMAQYTATDLANLAIASTTNRNTFNKLTKTISDKYSQITTLTNKLLAANKVSEKLKTEIE